MPFKFKIDLFDLYRNVMLGIPLILAIPSVVLLVDFTRHTLTQGSIMAFETYGFLIQGLTLVLLTILILFPLIWPKSPILYLASELASLVVLLCLWIGLVIWQAIWSDRWYPVPKNRHRRGANGCQFLPKDSPELHWCQRLRSGSSLAIALFVFLFMYCLPMFFTCLDLHRKNARVWLHSAIDMFGSGEKKAENMGKANPSDP